MTLTLPTREALVARMGCPPEEWAGNCHAASVSVAETIDGAVVRRGVFLGEATPGAYFYGRPCQHSWVELPDGQVCDPTRFAFVGGPAWPLWVGPSDEYDIAGCRSAAPAGWPPDPCDTTTWHGEERDYIELKLGCGDYVGGLLGTPPDMIYEDAVEVTLKQAYYLGNLPIKENELPGVLSRFFAAEVYEALVEAGFRETIPIDRRDWILGDGGKLYGRS